MKSWVNLIDEKKSMFSYFMLSLLFLFIMLNTIITKNEVKPDFDTDFIKKELDDFDKMLLNCKRNNTNTQFWEYSTKEIPSGDVYVDIVLNGKHLTELKVPKDSEPKEFVKWFIDGYNKV